MKKPKPALSEIIPATPHRRPISTSAVQYIKIYVSPDEKLAIEKKANSLGMSVSSFGAMLMLQYPS